MLKEDSGLIASNEKEYAMAENQMPIKIDTARIR